jgi:small subunit ribosomal protein S4
MARYTGPSCKLCRREKTKLFLKGDRCLNGKCSLEKRPTAPGQHGAGNVKVKEYGKQLREKQKAKRYYGLQEGQFKSYFKEADRVDGVTGENLLILLERRFDNVVYRMGMAESRKEARQLVLHGHFRVNGKKATIPSMLLKAGDVITVREESRASAKIKELVEGLDSRIAPQWLVLDKEAVKATIERLPVREDIDFPFTEQLIVELYSK